MQGSLKVSQLIQLVKWNLNPGCHDSKTQSSVLSQSQGGAEDGVSVALHGHETNSDVFIAIFFLCLSPSSFIA